MATEYASLMKIAKPPSARQLRILTFIRGYIEAHGYAPTYVEIMLGCEISSLSVVFYNLGGLARRGLLRLTYGEARAIVLTDGGPCPHCGGRA